MSLCDETESLTVKAYGRWRRPIAAAGAYTLPLSNPLPVPATLAASNELYRIKWPLPAKNYDLYDPTLWLGTDINFPAITGALLPNLFTPIGCTAQRGKDQLFANGTDFPHTQIMWQELPLTYRQANPPVTGNCWRIVQYNEVYTRMAVRIDLIVAVRWELLFEWSVGAVNYHWRGAKTVGSDPVGPYAKIDANMIPPFMYVDNIVNP